MILAAHQLHYLPWLRYFHKIANCDTFIVLDNIQFNKNGWQNRNKIKTPQGAALVTVPILNKFQQLISEVQIDTNQLWAKKHWRTIELNYRKAPFFKEHEAFFRKVYEFRPHGRNLLNDLNYKMFFYYVKALGIQTKIVRSSDLNLKGEATERLVGICKELGAKSYVTGAYATQVYLDAGLFRREGIELIMQEFKCPEYPQQFQEAGFVPELSIIDLLFNCGPRSLEVLMQGNSFPLQEKS